MYKFENLNVGYVDDNFVICNKYIGEKLSEFFEIRSVLSFKFTMERENLNELRLARNSPPIFMKAIAQIDNNIGSTFDTCIKIGNIY